MAGGDLDDSQVQSPRFQGFLDGGRLIDSNRYIEPGMDTCETAKKRSQTLGADGFGRAKSKTPVERCPSKMGGGGIVGVENPFGMREEHTTVGCRPNTASATIQQRATQMVLQPP